MSRVVLDASAVLAYLWKEKGWSQVEKYLLEETVLISSKKFLLIPNPPGPALFYVCQQKQ